MKKRKKRKKEMVEIQHFSASFYHWPRKKDTNIKKRKKRKKRKREMAEIQHFSASFNTWRRISTPSLHKEMVKICQQKSKTLYQSHPESAQ